MLLLGEGLVKMPIYAQQSTQRGGSRICRAQSIFSNGGMEGQSEWWVANRKHWKLEPNVGLVPSRANVARSQVQT